MNTNQLKSYAPAARRAFIAAVTAQLARYGITAAGNAPAPITGDVMIIAGQPYPAALAPTRAALIDRIAAHGFAPTVDNIAYTWFNRFAALRYMELHGFLDHGYRVLSHPAGHARPEILDRVADLDLPHLDRARALELKLAGNQDEELYRLILLAQCDALHTAMPFLFDRLGADTALAIPSNLLHTDSVIRQMVEQVDEDSWQNIEVVGWLYQFYISEKKDQVIGKVVKSEDIPAATQLFTPNWIVKYMVQNSLGAQWLATYPDSKLKEQMEYYIEPAEQTAEVNAQLAAITPSSLDPEALTLIDPACGSGHILVEAYDLFKAIYLERGYRQRDVPQLILEKNLFGLDIDQRAAQLTGFALMMRGRADDRQLFGRGVKLNVMALVDSTGFDAEALASGVKLSDYGLRLGDLTELKRLFEHATTFGSLIQVPEGLASSLLGLRHLSEASSQDMFVSDAFRRLNLLVQQAELLAARYDDVVANPPYMGGRFMTPAIKRFAADPYPDAKADLFACFIERSHSLAKVNGYSAMVTMESWLFLSTFESMRKRILHERTIIALAHLAGGIVCGFGTAAAVIRNCLIPSYLAGYSHTAIADLGPDGVPFAFPVTCDSQRIVEQSQFGRIPGSPVAYWTSERVRQVFADGVPLGEIVDVAVGLQTSDNARFLRLWSEVSASKSGFGLGTRNDAAASGKKWFPYNKGGGFRKWYGNQDFVLNWESDGKELFEFAASLYGSPTRIIKNAAYYFRKSVTWSFVGSNFGVRCSSAGAVFDVGGSSAFPTDGDYFWVAGLMCSKQVYEFMKVMNPTLNFQVGNVAALPILNIPIRARKSEIDRIVAALVNTAESDWDAVETSWGFQSLPFVTASSDLMCTVESSYTAWIAENRGTIAEMKRLEEENNRIFIDAYGLQDELTPDVPIEQITLTVNPAYRYSNNLTEEEQWTRFREDTMEELVSYAIGCMMGRYSLDEPGLIYANSGNEGFDPSRYPTFPADADGIIPLTDTEWFEDDAAHRLVEFISVAWDKSHLEENLDFLAENLSPKKNESSRETLRSYLCDKFFKDHLQTYKKRPIYWLFSSGKQKAFQCLVYLHRYNEGTLARMRSEYVIPLQGKMSARIDQLDQDTTTATSTAHRKTLEKERDRLRKQSHELREFDEKLRHMADQRITLDLDDGVKVNYGKFGDLLAEVKTIAGSTSDD